MPVKISKIFDFLLTIYYKRGDIIMLLNRQITETLLHRKLLLQNALYLVETIIPFVSYNFNI